MNRDILYFDGLSFISRCGNNNAGFIRLVSKVRRTLESCSLMHCCRL